jgi:polar amino acid transport system permease protein
MVSGAVVLALLGLLALAFANARISWGVVRQYLLIQQMLVGAERTMVLTVASMALGLILGMIGGVCRLSDNPVVSGGAWLYVWAFRGTPVLVQLLMWFNLALVFPQLSIPGVFHVSMNSLISPAIAAILGFGVNEGAYISEVFRGGMLAVGEGQKEAAAALGMSHFHTNRRVILPQAVRIILPTLGNETIGMLKLTSLASIVSFYELTETSEQIYYVNARVMELLIVASLWYLLLTSIFSIGQYYLERHLGRSLQRMRPPTLLERGIRGVLERISVSRRTA